MNLCSDGHDEVCYETRYCPCCLKIQEIRDSDDQCSAALKQIQALEDQLKELERLSSED